MGKLKEAATAKENRKPHGAFVNKKPKFPTKYHEMLQPLSPMTTLPVRSASQVKPSELLLKPSSINVERQEEFLKLMRECDVAKIESFLCQHSENIDINQFNSDGQTALHEACLAGDLARAEALLKYGASPHLTNRDGFSILHLATFSGNSELLMLAMQSTRL